MPSFMDETNCVHHPEAELDGFASFATAVYRASTIVFPDAQSYRTRGSRNPDGYSYGLNGTPTSRVLEANLTLLHGGERSILTPSGQAAITVVMLSLLRTGDHVLIPDNVYPPVKQFAADMLGPLGVAVGVYDPMDLVALRAAIMPGRTKLVWVEAPGSTTMEVCDIPAIAQAARTAGALIGCDNTWASPLLCKPLKLGIDIVVEALTKYVGGHSDLLLGSITFRDFELYRTVRRQMANLGVGVSPDDCALALRGLETMPIRLERAGRVARDFAERLVPILGADAVLHPALPNSPGHHVWKRDFLGSSGVFTLVLDASRHAGLDDALNQLEVFAIGASWGGTRSLVAPMGLGADRSLTSVEPNTTFLRVSIGLENPDELWADLTQFLEAL